VTATEAVRQLFVAVDSGDVDAICEHLTDDVRFRFSNAKAIVGKPAFQAASHALFDTQCSRRSLHRPER
jgi:ketosteroid isomerase-like protein